MSSENIIEEQKAANLARIRDNQRRSRARKKEYITELEERYRACEQVGIEASAEMQAAARRVIEENRFLRTLLKQHGYTDPDIDRAIQEGTSSMPSVPNLEALFGQRKRPNTNYDSSSSSTGQMPHSAGSSSNPTPSMSAARHLQPTADPSQMSHLYNTPYANPAVNASMAGSSMAQPGLMYGGQSQWTAYATSGVVPSSSARMHQQYDGMPSIQSIKLEVGYGPQEEIDAQSTGTR
ncbi:hypothetical protein AMS68_004477 [Peltaster fructicola]|uniref:BZIP domain-containing protein n=1 Tax=Peltaster fructicola TaxID=286661 RepID=A0A6H0XX01_9PEZI|nr:hypothetical protein AMS68_004477 [Peltaster fructicola]